MPMISESTPVAFSDPLPEATDVVVIGAGVIGTATAWFLAQRGAKVVLCEKGGSQASNRAVTGAGCASRGATGTSCRS